MLREHYRNASFIAVAGLIARLKGLILLPFLTRHLGALDFGIWSQLTVIVSVFAPLIVLGTDSGSIRYLPQQADKKQLSYYSALFVFVLGMSFFGAIGIISFDHQIVFLFLDDGEAHVRFIPLVVASMIVTILSNMNLRWFLIRNDGLSHSIVTVLQAIVSAITVTYALFFSLEIYDLVLLTVAADGVLVLLVIVAILVRDGVVSPDFAILHKIVFFGLPLLPSAYAMLGLNLMDRIFLVRYTSIAEIGMYSLAYGVGMIIVPMLAKPFRNMFPAMMVKLHARGDVEGMQLLFNHSAGVVFGLLLPAVVGLFLVGEPLIAVLGPPEFSPAAYLLGIVAASYSLSTLNNYFDICLSIAHRQVWTTYIIVLACTVNLVFNMLLIPGYGIWGAAIATLIAFVARFLATLIVSYNYWLFKLSIMFVLRVIISCSVMAFIVFLFKCIFELKSGSPFVGLFIMVFIGGGAYGVMLLITEVISFRDLRSFLCKVMSKVA
ncbi:polysaccharide biosynthesis C-terminal domain-containing protein [Kiloniella sp.]|uniref:oligosaccharide flippase family protein n=1 Tax=Kiloniella sp. TaxID=1938587 RepID=UPI003A93ADB9